MKGCFGVKPSLSIQVGKDLRFSTCPGNFYSNDIAHLLEMERMFSLGSMPFPGGVADQPNKLVEAFRVIQAHKADKLKAEQSKQRARTAIRGRR
jgi:hypothetical protein